MDLFDIADHVVPSDELKINCLKFIALNIVSYLEGTLYERLMSHNLPVYLLRELENFLKIEDGEKFGWFDMKSVENAEEIYR